MEILIYIYLGVGIFSMLLALISSMIALGGMVKQKKDISPGILLLVALPIVLIVSFLAGLFWPLYLFVFIPYKIGQA